MEGKFIRVQSVSQLFSMLGWENPTHPLIGIIDVTQLDEIAESKGQEFLGAKLVSELYSVILKDGDCGMQYGRNSYDFEEGVLRFIGPGQVVSSTSHTPSTYGFMLVFHPDLIGNFDLGKTIDRYNFFAYDVHEALHLSKKEENTLIEIVENIKSELVSHIDTHTQEVIVTNLQLLLNYSNRFYNRQFITRTNHNSDVVSHVEALLKEYYGKNLQLKKGTPSPEYFAEKVHFSANYLSDLLKKETGRTTKDHIDEYIVRLAKSSLLSSKQSVSEIAYNLGFNYPHYFSRMFKKRVGMSPVEFRSESLN